MSGGPTALHKQLAELRMLVAQAMAVKPEGVFQGNDPIAWAERVAGFPLDPWQREVISSEDARLAILVCRQGGKSTIVALKGADLVRRGGLAVIVAPSLRQSSLLFRKMHHILVGSGETFRRETQTEVETARGGMAICLPGDRPDMLRGLSLRWHGPSLLIVDEASRVREALWSTVSPMLAAAPLARQALLSTPAGAAGEFWRIMTQGEAGWRRISVTADDCPRIPAEFLARERLRLGPALYEQEYFGQFIAAPGSVFSADLLAAMFGDSDDTDDSIVVPAFAPRRPNGHGGTVGRLVL